jgi:hypothetical protein
MKTIVIGVLALFMAVPAVASAAEADVVISTHRHQHYRHDNRDVGIYQNGQRLHHRRHGDLAFYDHGRRHHRPDTVVTGSISTRHHYRHHPAVIQDDSRY